MKQIGFFILRLVFLCSAVGFCIASYVKSSEVVGFGGAIGYIFICIFAIGCAICWYGLKKRCPDCGKWFAIKEKNSVKTGERLKKINEKGEAEYEETHDVTYGCKHCDYEYVEEQKGSKLFHAIQIPIVISLITIGSFSNKCSHDERIDSKEENTKIEQPSTNTNKNSQKAKKAKSKKTKTTDFKSENVTNNESTMEKSPLNESENQK